MPSVGDKNAIGAEIVHGFPESMGGLRKIEREGGKGQLRYFEREAALDSASWKIGLKIRHEEADIMASGEARRHLFNVHARASVGRPIE